MCLHKNKRACVSLSSASGFQNNGLQLFVDCIVFNYKSEPCLFTDMDLTLMIQIQRHSEAQNHQSGLLKNLNASCAALSCATLLGLTRILLVIHASVLEKHHIRKQSFSHIRVIGFGSFLFWSSVIFCLILEPKCRTPWQHNDWPHKSPITEPMPNQSQC